MIEKKEKKQLEKLIHDIRSDLFIIQEFIEEIEDIKEDTQLNISKDSLSNLLGETKRSYQNIKGKISELAKIINYFPKVQKNNRRILITGGGTSEFIDPIRYITNISTGQTASEIADFLFLQGFSVTYLSSRNSIYKPLYLKEMEELSFFSSLELDTLLKQVLGTSSFDGIIHLAAVSDFKVESLEIDNQKFLPHEIGKISSGSNVSIKLKNNIKIVDNIRKYSKNNLIKVVAFKLTNTFDQELRQQKVQELISRQIVDFVVLNDFNDFTDQDRNKRSFWVFDKKFNLLLENSTKQNLYEMLVKINRS